MRGTLRGQLRDTGGGDLSSPHLGNVCVVIRKVKRKTNLLFLFLSPRFLKQRFLREYFKLPLSTVSALQYLLPNLDKWHKVTLLGYSPASSIGAYFQEYVTMIQSHMVQPFKWSVHFVLSKFGCRWFHILLFMCFEDTYCSLRYLTHLQYLVHGARESASKQLLCSLFTSCTFSAPSRILVRMKG